MNGDLDPSRFSAQEHSTAKPRRLKWIGNAGNRFGGLAASPYALAGAVGAIALLLGLLLGYITSGPVRDEVDRLTAENVAAAESASALDEEIQVLESEISSLESDVSERDAVIDEIDDRESELDQRDSALDEREAEIEEIETALDEREQELTSTEKEIEDNTIPGDGIWLVGDEVEPGMYQAQGSGSSCYWARLNSLDTFDIINNHFGSANVTVEIHGGDAAFETSGCGSWLKK